MISTINELVSYTFLVYNANNETNKKAQYIANRMQTIFNKAKWSCVIGYKYNKAHYYWGVNLNIKNNLYYVYEYSELIYIIFAT